MKNELYNMAFGPFFQKRRPFLGFYKWPLFYDPSYCKKGKLISNNLTFFVIQKSALYGSTAKTLKTSYVLL